MKTPKPVIVDFETFGIMRRPQYPPVPVGVSIMWPGKTPKYYAWGHPTGNNCTWPEARQALLKAWSHEDGVCFQNGKFDVDVAEVHMGLPLLPWHRVHDTMFLLFLDDPNQKELGLKPSAARLLGMPPEEQDAVVEWLVANQPIPGIKISSAKKSDHYAGKYIAFAPADLVGFYANGDSIRTGKLFDLLYKKTVERKMLEAYNRERKLMPILLEMERQGVPVDVKRLASDCDKYQMVHDQLTEWVRKRLKCPELNIDSGDQLVKALISVNKVDTDLLGLTDKGKYKTDKESLDEAITDAQLTAVLKYRTQLGTCLKTFMYPWLEMAKESGGFIYTNWNQVKGAVGTRTGRLSSTPNFQNIPKEFDPIFRHEESDAKKARLLPLSPIKDLPGLPQVRSYIVPLSNLHVLLDRDYSQQELRILAHFEDDILAEAYGSDQWLDVHDHIKDLVNNMLRKNFERKPIKNTVFGLIYGMGVGKLAIKSGITVSTAQEVKDAILNVFPGLKQMYKDMKALSKANQPFATWGGREYYCEPPMVINGRMKAFDYKMLNGLIQGSAADCSKEALIRYYKIKSPEARVLLTVHDEFLIDCPKKIMADEMRKLTSAMESLEFSVPMLSEGKTSTENWASLKSYDKKGVLV